MRFTVTNFLSSVRRVVANEGGQDLVEYALVVALIALAATAGMSSLASSINTGFSNLGSTLTGAV